MAFWAFERSLVTDTTHTAEDHNLQQELRDGALQALRDGAFDGLWTLVDATRAAQVEALRNKANEIESMTREVYFADQGVHLSPEVCARVLGLTLPGGAEAQWAVRFGKPWSIRLNYHDGTYSLETHCSLDWKRR
jgi:hypothetical protein